MRITLTRLAIASLLVSGAILLQSDRALAASTTVKLDACQVSCPKGSCSASASIWQFWEDCTCDCTPEGWGRCGC